MNLWSNDILREHTNFINHNQQKLEWTSGQTMREKFDYLQLDLWGSVTVDLKMSKITAEGSFKYLTDTKVLIFVFV